MVLIIYSHLFLFASSTFFETISVTLYCTLKIFLLLYFQTSASQLCGRDRTMGRRVCTVGGGLQEPPPCTQPHRAEWVIVACVGLVDLGNAETMCHCCRAWDGTSVRHPTVHIALLVWWDTWTGVVGHLDGCGEATGSVWWDTWTSTVGQPLGGSLPWCCWLQQICSSAQLCVKAKSRLKKKRQPQRAFSRVYAEVFNRRSPQVCNFLFA